MCPDTKLHHSSAQAGLLLVSEPTDQVQYQCPPQSPCRPGPLALAIHPDLFIIRLTVWSLLALTILSRLGAHLITVVDC